MGLTARRLTVLFVNQLEYIAMRYLIVCTECAPADAAFWSNEYGWTDRESADVFTDEERATLNLPMFGDWAPITE